MTESTPLLRVYSNYRGEYIRPPFDRRTLICTGDLTDELIATIEIYSEIKETTLEVLKNKGHQNLEEAYLKLRAYIRQAKTFYEAAQSLHHRAMPLVLYYSYMNFAKAFIFLNEPGFVDSNLRHGIHTSYGPGGLSAQKISVSNGIFPRFYKKITGYDLKIGTQLKPIDLFGYIGDVANEYTKLGFGHHRSFPTKMSLAHDQANANIHVLLAVAGNCRRPQFQELADEMSKDFSEIELPQYLSREIFDLRGGAAAGCRFFESKATTPTDLKTEPEFLKAFFEKMNHYMTLRPFPDPYLLNLDLSIGTNVKMNEFLANYCLMYFLGSLVRYRPEIIEGMLTTKDAFILERFIRTSTSTFLRYFRNAFVNENHAFETR